MEDYIHFFYKITTFFLFLSQSISLQKKNVTTIT